MFLDQTVCDYYIQDFKQSYFLDQTISDYYSQYLIQLLLFYIDGVKYLYRYEVNMNLIQNL